MGDGRWVGLEDNIYYDVNRTKLERNIDFLKRIHVIAEANERPVMSPRELRQVLQLEKGNGCYGRAIKTEGIAL